jgi:hypothetical protein
VRSALLPLLLFCIALVLLAGCSKPAAPATSATITKLAIGSNPAADPTQNAFEIGNVIYVVATVANAVGKHNLSFKVMVEDNVPNKVRGDVVMSKSVDFEGVQPLFLNFSIAYPGLYKVEAVLTDEKGTLVDSRSGLISSTGEPAPLEKEHERDYEDADRDREHNIEKDQNHDRKRETERERGRDKVAGH